MRFRVDKNALALFDERTGAKIRFAIGPYTKAHAPELVDLKITDYCKFGCKYCYQGSSTRGQHASVSNLTTVVDRLAKAKVFEVAIGGGEPTTHPDFLAMLRWFHERGVVPNFTTKDLGFVVKYWKEIEPFIGGFAYSPDAYSPGSLAAEFLKIAALPDRVKAKLNLHYVMGLADQEWFIRFMLAAHVLGLRVTLLGYKTTGRGKNVPHKPYGYLVDSLIALVAQGVCPATSIDTPLAEQFDGMLPCSKKMYHTQEGKFSAYIDAVAMRFGASSFEEQNNLIPFESDWIIRYKEM